jgi:hypothetical protein
MGSGVGSNGEAVAPSDVQEYLGAVGLKSMEVVRAI